MMENMAQVHMTEAELARDLHAVLEKVRQGVEIVVDRNDQPVAVIPFEPQLFGAAANNGQMIAEISAGHRTAEVFRQLAQHLTGRAEPKKQRSGLIPPLLEKLLQR